MTNAFILLLESPDKVEENSWFHFLKVVVQSIPGVMQCKFSGQSRETTWRNLTFNTECP